MSLSSRIALLFHTRAQGLLDAAEDPREVLALALDTQREQLHAVRAAVADLAAARRGLEREEQRLQADGARYEEQARRALRTGREDLARRALRHQQDALRSLEETQRRTADLRQQEQRYADLASSLGERVSRFAAHRRVESARYTAATAQLRVQGTLAGSLDRVDGVTLAVAVERVADAVEDVEARAEAMSEPFIPFSAPDPTEDALREEEIASAVEERLAALKRDLEEAESGNSGEAQQ